MPAKKKLMQVDLTPSELRVVEDYRKGLLARDKADAEEAAYDARKSLAVSKVKKLKPFDVVNVKWLGEGDAIGLVVANSRRRVFSLDVLFKDGVIQLIEYDQVLAHVRTLSID